MTASARTALRCVLEQAGFLLGDHLLDGVIGSEEASRDVNASIRYGELFGAGDSEADLVYEVPSQIQGVVGIPSIYFKVLDDANPNDIVNIRQRVWNQGRSPTLWIATPDGVRIYDSFARPQSEDDDSSHLIEELKIVSGRLRGIEKFHKSQFDNGAFWEEGPGRKINRSERVDEALVKDLQTTERLLVSRGLSSSVAHALLGRVIFVSYLQDRCILSKEFFRSTYNVNSFKEILYSKQATYTFFAWLSKTFNGDLFVVSTNEEVEVKEEHLQILQYFLAGDDLTNYPECQSRFWPYRFEIIPIELISSIYEMFAHSRDRSSAEASSVHYTRLPLVELALSLSMKTCTHKTRVLDPACGSGVFLVEAFRRLVWLTEREKNRRLNRTELHEILKNQIFGIDIDHDALQITAFSLFLMLLELDPDPQPPEDLKFPSLFKSTDGAKAPNLCVQDFLNVEHSFNKKQPFSNQGFGLIVGNPPWTALSSSSAPTDPATGRQWSLEFCQKKEIPDCKVDQAFMVRARDIAGPDSVIAFVVASRLLYQQMTEGREEEEGEEDATKQESPLEKSDSEPQKSNKKESWFSQFLGTIALHEVVNLSDLVAEKILYGGKSSTKFPSSILTFSTSKTDPNHNVIYITPKWYSSVSKRGAIMITSADVQRLPQSLLRNNPVLWKSSFRGTPRDFRLIDKLQKFSTLDQLLRAHDILPRRDRGRGVTFGKGEQKTSEPLYKKPFLPSGVSARYQINVGSLEILRKATVAKKSNRQLLQLPILVLSRSLLNCQQKVALIRSSKSRTHVSVDQTYYGISLSKSKKLASRLNAILNSKLAMYAAFMMSPAVGWDRHLIEVVDWLRTPVPSSLFDKPMPKWEKLLEVEHWLRKHWAPDADKAKNKKIKEYEEELNRLVYEIYECSAQEIILIEDTIRYTVVPYLLRHSKKKKPSVLANVRPGIDDLKRYVHRVSMQFSEILAQDGKELSATIANPHAPSHVQACRFEIRESSQKPIVKEARLEINDILNDISADLRTQVADRLYVQRDLRVYDENVFWIIKPSEKRLWSESTALNDSDTVLREFMENFDEY